MRNPDLTICIPTSDRPAWLQELIETLDAMRTEVIREIIVSNDGRSELSIRDATTPVRILTGPRRGPAANRNRLLHAAETDWILFIDDDCLPTPSWIPGMVKAIVSDAERHDAFEGRTTLESPRRSALDRAIANEGGGKFLTCNMAVFRPAALAIGGFDAVAFADPACEDIDFCMRLGRDRVAFVRDALVHHRLIEDSVWGPARRIRLLRCNFELLSRHRAVWERAYAPIVKRQGVETQATDRAVALYLIFWVAAHFWAAVKFKASPSKYVRGLVAWSAATIVAVARFTPTVLTGRIH